jgi:MFS superfamily sulfate permease-like transporter
LGSLTAPDFSGLLVPAVYKTAVVLAVVASLETLLCVEATDRLDPQKRVTPTNRELKAQGLGNIVSGLLGGLPVTQVIVRSSANVQAGGRTKLSAIMHGVLLAIGIIALPSLMNTIPLATLAAILLVVGYKLAKPSLFAKLYREGPAQFVPFVATIAGIVLTDLLIGIAIGLGIAVVGILYESYKIPFQLQRLPDEPDRVRIVLSQQVTFLNKASIMRALAAVPRGSIVEIDATRSAFVHHDVVEIIDDFVDSAPRRDVTVVVEGLEHEQKGAPSAGIEVAVEPMRPQ